MKANEGRLIPLSIHKRLIIAELEARPRSFRKFVPGAKSAKQAVRELREHPGNWIVDGALRTDEDHAAYMKETYNFTWRD